MKNNNIIRRQNALPGTAAATSAAVLVILSMCAGCDRLPGSRSSRGIYEYLREGEKLVDVGKFAKALNVYEEAYEISPDEPSVKSGIVWAYTLYAKEREGAGKHEDAIAAFERAREIKQDNATIVNLSAAYERMAVDRSVSNDWSDAIIWFRKMRAVALESVHARKQVAILLYNSAVDEYAAGRTRSAERCVSESLLLDEEPYALALAGDICFKKNDPEEALFFYEKALSLDSALAGISEKAGQMRRETSIASSRRHAELAHFVLSFDAVLALDADMVTSALERAYLDIGAFLGYYLESKTPVYLYTEEDFRKVFQLPEATRAFYDGSIRMPFPKGAMTAEEVRHYVYHEYTHAVVSAMTKGRTPSWLNEGIAMWCEWLGQEGAIFAAAKAVQEKGSFTLASVSVGFEKNTGGEEMQRFYLMAHTAVGFIAKTWGDGKVRRILTRIKDGQHVLNAIDDEFLLTEDEFNARWNDFVQHVVVSLPVKAGTPSKNAPVA